jgi:hypothetical protein
VAAHVISYDELDARGLLAHVVRGWFRPDQVNAAALVGYDTRTPGQLLALLTDHLQPRGLPAALGGRVALVEALIHHQDIRRPLGLPRAIPPERLLPALRTALIAPDIGGLWRIRGVRLVATDLGFSAGAGQGARYGRGAADDHSWPPRRHERAIWTRPTEVCRPPPQLTGSRRDSQARASDSQHDEVASRDFRTARA